MILSTLCYIEKDNKYLMLHRTKKKNDINKDKLNLNSYKLRTIVTYVSTNGETEY